MRLSMTLQEWQDEYFKSVKLLGGVELVMPSQTKDVAQELVRAVKSRKQYKIKHYGKRSSTGVRISNLHRAALCVDKDGNVFAWLIDDNNNYEMPLIITPADAKMRAVDFADAVIHIGSQPFDTSHTITMYDTWGQIKSKKKKGKK